MCQEVFVLQAQESEDQCSRHLIWFLWWKWLRPLSIFELVWYFLSGNILHQLVDDIEIWEILPFNGSCFELLFWKECVLLLIKLGKIWLASDLFWFEIIKFERFVSHKTALVEVIEDIFFHIVAIAEIGVIFIVSCFVNFDSSLKIKEHDFNFFMEQD